ncbi:glycosyltransferase [Dyella subtropica]|uniref:glycosyltransferase n=1 Tax=Dyella subtropica TaxID=2992127 RepID=UPI0022595755|nr:glycosyltransferase [Dyella subtropica]
MSQTWMPRVAVLIPCFNEAVAIPIVVRDFAAALPQARVYVYDNNSTVEAA